MASMRPAKSKIYGVGGAGVGCRNVDKGRGLDTHRGRLDVRGGDLRMSKGGPAGGPAVPALRRMTVWGRLDPGNVDCPECASTTAAADGHPGMSVTATRP